MGMVRMILLPQQSACALRDGLRGIIVPVEAFSDKRNEKENLFRSCASPCSRR